MPCEKPTDEGQVLALVTKAIRVPQISRTKMDSIVVKVKKSVSYFLER